MPGLRRVPKVAASWGAARRPIRCGSRRLRPDKQRPAREPDREHRASDGRSSERDRAQLAAHEVSLRSRFEGLPVSELAARHRELESAAFQEEGNQRVHDPLTERIEQVRARQRERDDKATRPAQVRRPDREELRWMEVTERQSRRELERLHAELAATPAPTDAARREFMVADQVLAERERLAVAAARAAPPAYIGAELGPRPSDPAKQKVWDRAVADIESFRLRNGVNDPKRALGREVERSAQRERQRQTPRQIREANRQLGRGEFAAQRRSVERGGLSIGR